MIDRAKYSKCLVCGLLASLMLAIPFAGIASTQALAQSLIPPHANVLLDMSPVKFPVEPYIETGTTMVPLRALGEALGAEIGWDDNARAATYSKDGLTLVVTIGETSILTSEGQTVLMPKPATLLNGHTMVPVRLFSEILGYQVFWEQATHTVKIVSSVEPIGLWGFYALGSSEYSSWQDVFGSKYPFTADDFPAQKMNGIFLGWFAIDEDGSVTSKPNQTGFQKPDGWPAVIYKARLDGLEVFSMYFADEQSSNISKLLDDSVTRNTLAKNIASTSIEDNGVLIDFEGLGLDTAKIDTDKQNFNLFLDVLRDYLGDKPLYVALPPLNSSFQGYDHKYIATVADSIVLMAYHYHDPNTPSAAAPFEKVDEAIRQEVEIIDPGNIILGIPAYGTAYKITGDTASVHSLPASKDGLTSLPGYDSLASKEMDTGTTYAKPVFNPEYLCNYVTWKGKDTSYKAYLEDTQSLKARLLMAKRYGIRQAAIWRLGLLTDDWWPQINEVVDVVRQGPHNLK